MKKIGILLMTVVLGQSAFGQSAEVKSVGTIKEACAENTVINQAKFTFENSSLEILILGGEFVAYERDIGKMTRGKITGSNEPYAYYFWNVGVLLFYDRLLVTEKATLKAITPVESAESPLGVDERILFCE